MIFKWDEINRRFDYIKDRKPKATQKLRELGEILASAYRLDNKKADEMWQYIIDLNIKEDITSAQYYVLQVFKKIIDNLTYEESADFFYMNSERINLFFSYCNTTGDVLVTYCIIGYQIINNRIEKAVSLMCLMDERIISFSESDEYYLYSRVDGVCDMLERKPEQLDKESRGMYDISQDLLQAFYDGYLIRTNNETLKKYLYAKISLLKQKNELDTEDITSILSTLSRIAGHTNKSITKLFMKYLCFVKEIINNEAAEVFLINYYNNENISYGYFPDHFYYSDEISRDDFNWISKVIMKSPEIIHILYSKQICYGWIRDNLHMHMYKSDWDTFDDLVVLGLNQKYYNHSESYLNFIVNEIEDYLSVKGKKIEKRGKMYVAISEPKESTSENSSISFSSTTSHMLLEKPRLNKDNIHGFIKSLLYICLLSKNCLCYEELAKRVRKFVIQETEDGDNR